MHKLPPPLKLERCLAYLTDAGLVSDPNNAEVRQTVAKVIAAAEDRIKLASDILDFDDFFVADEQLEFDPTTFDKRLRGDAAAQVLLAKFRQELAQLEPFTVDSTEACLKAFVAAQDIKFNQIIHALRVAVTGKPVGFGMFDALAILGKDRCLNRIDRALQTSQ
jgi:glutamyl-tRNA synthetase